MNDAALKHLVAPADGYPSPGDLVVTRHRMRAWETDWRRGTGGVEVESDKLAVILQVWPVGPTRVRVTTFVDGKVAVFSCRDVYFFRNWRVVATASGSK